MENKEIAEMMDQHRWLLNNGLVPDNAKNQLFFYGSIVHKSVQAVELTLEPEKRLVKYTIYVNPDLLKNIELYHRLSKSAGLISMWRFKRLLKKHGSLDFQQLLSKFVKDFCGPMWKTEVVTVDFNNYIEEVGESSDNGGPSQQDNQLPD